jgi:hypothetical protein
MGPCCCREAREVTNLASGGRSQHTGTRFENAVVHTKITSNIYAAITEPSIIPEAPDWESFAPDDPETIFDHDITCPPFTEPIYDTTRPLFTDSNGNPVYFSAGSGVSDPLAESLARALRAAEIHNPTRPFAHDEVPLQDLDEDEDEDEEGSTGQFSGMFILF